MRDLNITHNGMKVGSKGMLPVDSFIIAKSFALEGLEMRVGLCLDQHQQSGALNVQVLELLLTSLD